MQNFNLDNEFIRSLSTVNNSKENFFYIKLPYNKNLKIYLDESGCEWVLKYKYKIKKRALKFKKALKSNVSDEVFCFLCYFYEFVMPDILALSSLLPQKASKILDIGAGIGLFELYLNHLYGKKSDIDLIEVNKLTQLDHHNKNIQPKKLDRPLNVLNLAKKFLGKNKIDNVKFIDSNKFNSILSSPYDLVISIRSWGFLFDLDKYLNYVNNNLSNNGIVIADINKRTLCKKKFEKTFANVKIIGRYMAHYRLIGTKKTN